MRILVVTTSYPRFVGDPAGNFVEGHVEALRSLGHEVDVLAAGPTSIEASSAVGVITNAMTGSVESYSGPRHDKRHDEATRIPSKLFYKGGAPDLIEARGWRAAVDAARFTIQLGREIRRRQPDQIIAHWLAPSAIAALPSRIPLLAIAHGGDIHLLRRLRLLAPTLYALRARGARLAFVSSELRAIAQRAAPSLASWIGRATVQPMGIDIERFGAIARQPTARPTILIVSRLVPVKGIDVAIGALRHLQTPTRLVIAGDGPQRDSLLSFTATSISAESSALAETRPAPLAAASRSAESSALAESRSSALTAASRSNSPVASRSNDSLTAASRSNSPVASRSNDSLAAASGSLPVASRSNDSLAAASRSLPVASRSNGWLAVASRSTDPLAAASRSNGSLVEGSTDSLVAGPRSFALGAHAVEFLGEVSADERDRLLSTASVVVVPSRVLPNGRTEGTPLIALEALAAGVPVVASAVGGLAELPVHRVRPDDPRALAAAIDDVLGAAPDPARLRGLAGAYAWSRVAAVLR